MPQAIYPLSSPNIAVERRQRIISMAGCELEHWIVPEFGIFPPHFCRYPAD